MPKAAQHHALARQWELLKQLPSRAPGITARELVTQLNTAGFAVTKRTIERDLVELAGVFGIECNDKSTPFGWSLNLRHIQPRVLAPLNLIYLTKSAILLY